MPELIFNIIPKLDESIGSVEKRLSEVQEKANKATASSTSTTKKQAEATEDLNKKFRRLTILNETRFRQGKIGQQQALKNAQAIERAALSQGVLNDKTLKGVQAQKTMFLSQQRIQTGFTGMAATSATANRSLVNLGRIVQDLPFGFLGISNNIDPALNSFKQLREETGSTRGALGALLRSLKGSGGLIFALGSLLPTAFLVAQTGFNMFSKKAKEAEVSVEDVVGALADLRDFGTFSFLDTDGLQRQIDSIKDMRGALDEILMARKEAVEIEAQFQRGEGQFVIEQAKERLKSLEEQYGFTAKEAQELVDIQAKLQKQLSTIDARSEFATLGAYVESIEEARDQTLLYFNTGEISASELQSRVQFHLRAASALKEEAKSSEQVRVKMEAHLKSAEQLGSVYNLLPAAIDAVNNSDRERVSLLEQVRQKAEEARKAEIERMKRLENIPKAEKEDFSDENKALRQAEIAQQLNTELQIAQARGVAQKRLEIERDYHSKVIDLARQGLLTKEIFDNLELLKHKELEQAKTETTKQEEENRKNIRQKLTATSLGLASNYFSALMQLNQAQTDETERQARAKFNKQKQLQTSSAIVSGLMAVTRLFSDFPFPVALGLTPVVGAITGAQIEAIQATEFESSSQPEAATPGVSITQSDSFNRPAVGNPIQSSKQKSDIIVQIDNKIDRKGLYSLVKKGEQEERLTQIS